MTVYDSRPHQLWFLRHRGKVRGPYPLGLVKRYIILSRIGVDDELSYDQENWKPFAEFPELAVKRMASEADDLFAQQRLLAAQRWADERIIYDDELGNMTGVDRRMPDSVAGPGLHEKRHDHFLQLKVRKKRSQIMHWVISFIVLLAVVSASIYVWMRYDPQQNASVESECHLSPRSGINWDNCQLEGIVYPRAKLDKAHMQNMNLNGAVLDHSSLRQADLSYTIMTLINLSASDLTGATLIGVNLRNANLTDTKFNHADLSYANLIGADLVGADLTGVVLDHVKWINGYVCKPGSVGRCQ